MAELTSHDTIAAHLRRCLAGGDRWCFLTDCQPGRTILGGLAAVVLLEGTDPEDVVTAAFDFLVIPTRHTVSVTLLSVPKSALSAADIRDLLAAVGLSVPPRDGQDVFLLGNDPAYLAGVLELLTKGKCYPAGQAANN